MLTPDDDALLSDLLDDRLSAEAERALTLRLEQEPALREAFDGLVRLRALLAEGPAPEPPPGFVAGVRARLAGDGLAVTAPRGARDDDVGLEDDADDEAPAVAARAAAPRPGFPHDGHAAAAGRAEPAAPPLRAASPGPVPLVWRRLMTVAYAAAALLVVGVGLLAVRDRERDAARKDPGELARGSGRDGRVEGKLKGPAWAAGERDEARELSAGVPRTEADDLVPPPAEPAAPPPQAPAASAPPPLAARDAEDGRPGKAGPDGRARGGFAGPGGALPPGLRKPSDEVAPDSPAAAGSAPVPASAPAPASRPTPQPAPARPSDEVQAAREPWVLVLEATDLASGRALVEALIAGPRPAPAAGSGAPSGGAADPDFRHVRLRRFDPSQDAALLRGLSTADRERLGRVADRSAAAPARGGLSGPAPSPLPALPGTAGPGLTAPGATAPVPVAVAAKPALGVESFELSPEQLARLEAVLGPAPQGSAQPTAPPGAGRAKDDAGAADAGERPDGEDARDKRPRAQPPEPRVTRPVRVLIAPPR